MTPPHELKRLAMAGKSGVEIIYDHDSIIALVDALEAERALADRLADATTILLEVSENIFAEEGITVTWPMGVRAALAAVASGNVEAGFVYRTDAVLEPRVRVAFEVPRAEGPRIVCPLALLRGAGETGKALHRYLASPEAGRIFDRYGFGRPEAK